MLFLNLRLAFWVAIGIPVSLAGALTFFPTPGLDLSINVISAFGFLIVLGVVVDDAIVIGESIYSEKEKDAHAEEGDGPIRTTVRGVSKVVTPATFGVITTIAAFLPLTQVSGRMGNVFGQIATAVILCLIFSLIESKLILPSHLAHLNVHKKPSNAVTKTWARFQKAVANRLKWLIDTVYRPVIRFVIAWRYATVGAFVAVFIVVVGLFPSGQLRFVFFPNIYRDNAAVLLELEANYASSFFQIFTEIMQPFYWSLSRVSLWNICMPMQSESPLLPMNSVKSMKMNTVRILLLRCRFQVRQMIRRPLPQNSQDLPLARFYRQGILLRVFTDRGYY